MTTNYTPIRSAHGSGLGAFFISKFAKHEALKYARLDFPQALKEEGS